MNATDLSELRDSEVLLNSAEKSFPSPESVQAYEDALELLDCVVDTCEENISSFIINMKYSHARSLVTRLQRIKLIDFGLFCQYLGILLFQLDRELRKMKSDDPALFSIFKESIAKFRPQF